MHAIGAFAVTANALNAQGKRILVTLQRVLIIKKTKRGVKLDTNDWGACVVVSDVVWSMPAVRLLHCRYYFYCGVVIQISFFLIAKANINRN